MGSLRNPVGPLPSTIYWRRRAVLLSALALLTLLVAWIALSGDGGGKNAAGGSNGKNPASSITPGPSASGPAISQHPGGRDESTPGDSNGTGSGGGSDDGGSGTGAGAGDAGGASGGDDGSNGSGSAGAALPAGTGLPNCTASVVTWTLSSVSNTYSPDQTPTFRFTARNSSASDCKVDLGPKTTVLTITQTGSDDAYWASADCPKTSGSALYRVPAGSSFTYTLKWDRKPSAPQCATPPAGSATAGTYLVEAKAPGFAKAQTSFVLEAD
ncbi:hypothetical protein ABZX85_46750 [Streptomyces sp. NPDC004539]|uniref:hypothetical protein n=1 Tax=Streptomyces sp. NPDC004539 TaxID=3154280 RepID=UPI0033B935F0